MNSPNFIKFVLLKIFGIEKIHMKYHCATFYWTQAVGLSSAGKGFLAKECKDCSSDCYVMTAVEKCACATRGSI
jgi:hypothetical protein